MPDPTLAPADLERLRYPIGRFQPRALDGAARAALIDDLARLPGDLRAAVAPLTPEQLDTPYRPGGWTVRQVVHHVPDSHLNGYVRFKWAVTEERPSIKTYDQAAWAALPDGSGPDVEGSLALLDALHRRWVGFLRAIPDAAFDRVALHPEWGEVTVAIQLQIYAWHGRHHLGHVLALRAQRGG